MTIEISEHIFAAAQGGGRLSAADLAEAWRADILSLGMLAEACRRRGRDARVAYVRTHEVTPAALAAGSPVPAAASALRLLTLPESRAEAVAAVRAARAAAGSRVVRAFSLADLERRASQGWGELSGLLADLAAAGLTDLDELPADRVDDLNGAVRLVRGAGLRGARITVAAPMGARRVAVIDAVRVVQETLGGLERFAPLPRHPAADVPTTGYDDLRTVALARLAIAHLAPDLAFAIEVDWRQYGPKLAQVALTFGADALDAVAAESDAALGHRRSAKEDVERNIRAAGYDPVETGRQASA
ncbi:MAG: hypothetical protein AB1635_02655 [Acidobacteriota bacterium]